MMVAVWIVLALLVLWLFAGLVVFLMACRKTAPIPLDKPELVYARLGKTHADLVYHEGLAFLGAHPAEELRMMSEDGLTLRGRFVANPKNRGTVVMFHGWHGCAETDLSPVFRYYYSLGVNLLFVDQRGQNGSSGKFVTFGVRESRDAARWVEYHNRNLRQCPVILDGISMGASTVLMAMGLELPENVVGVIADSGFSSPREIIAHVFRRVTHLPGWLVMGAVGLWCRVLGGFPVNHCTLETTKGSNLPLFLLHGRKDNFVPSAMSQAVYDAYRGEKEILLVEEAGHGMSYLVQPELCRVRLRGFFDRILGELEE